MRSIEARIRHAKDEAEQLTNAFILARNDMLRANIERKMQEIEILIKDLSASKAQIELERGKRFTKDTIIDFIAEMLKGAPADKEYQKTLIDNLVYKVFVYDDHIITYLTFGNEKDIKEISLADNDKAIDELKVQPLSSLVRITGLEPAQPCDHKNLNLTRLPIPPYPLIYYIFPAMQVAQHDRGNIPFHRVTVFA